MVIFGDERIEPEIRFCNIWEHVIYSYYISGCSEISEIEEVLPAILLHDPPNPNKR